VETAMGLGRLDVPGESADLDESAASTRAPAAAIELLRKVLRFMDSITGPFRCLFSKCQDDCERAAASAFTSAANCLNLGVAWSKNRL